MASIKKITAFLHQSLANRITIPIMNAMQHSTDNTAIASRLEAWLWRDLVLPHDSGKHPLALPLSHFVS